MKEPGSPLTDEVRRYGERRDEAPPSKPEPSTATIIMAGVAVFLLLALALPAVASIFGPPPASQPATVPTARVALETPAPPTAPPPTAPPPVEPTATAATADVPSEAQPLPATMPAGATPDDRVLTIYQGWPYRVTGARAGDSCELEVWAEGQPRDLVWIDCPLLGL